MVQGGVLFVLGINHSCTDSHWLITRTEAWASGSCRPTICLEGGWFSPWNSFTAGLILAEHLNISYDHDVHQLEAMCTHGRIYFPRIRCSTTKSRLSQRPRQHCNTLNLLGYESSISAQAQSSQHNHPSIVSSYMFLSCSFVCHYIPWRFYSIILHFHTDAYIYMYE